MKPAVLFSLILVAACARSEDASVRPAESNDSAAQQPRRDASEEQELTVGEWREALEGERPSLEFGPAGTTPILTIVCGEGGGLVVARRGSLPAGASAMLGVTVGTQTRQLPVTVGTGATETQNAAIPAADPLIAQWAAAQAPVTMRFGDGTPLLLPPTPLLGTFSRTCASGGGRATAPAAAGAEPGAADNAAAPAGNETNAAAER